MDDVWEPIDILAKKVENGELTAVGLVKRALAIIADKNPIYNAIIATTEERALERAKNIDIRVARGEKIGRLAGVPYIAKDNYSTFGAETTAASNMLKGYRAPYQATVIEKLEKEGAICVAKANLDAFAHGGSTENSDYMTTKNPYDVERVAGGSSGGSAASVALGMAPFALGSDTGGSIRQPASFCGVVGFKSTYGLVSRSGVVAMASSTDVMGPLTSRVEDAALVVDVIAGRDDKDSTTIERSTKSYTDLDIELKGKKIGIITECFGQGNNPAVIDTVNSAIIELKNAGAEVSEVSIPTIAVALAVYYVVVPAELSSNLSRHDGQRYQYAVSGAKTLHDSYELSRTRGFGAEAKRRIMIGTHVLSSGYYDAYYKKAQTVRTKLINEFSNLFEEYDFLVSPVAPTTAFKVGELVQDPLAMYMQDYNSVAVSLVGLPAISVPCGEISGLPVGLQIIGPQQADREVLSIAKAYEGLPR